MHFSREFFFRRSCNFTLFVSFNIPHDQEQSKEVPTILGVHVDFLNMCVVLFYCFLLNKEKESNTKVYNGKFNNIGVNKKKVITSDNLSNK